MKILYEMILLSVLVFIVGCNGTFSGDSVEIKVDGVSHYLYFENIGIDTAKGVVSTMAKIGYLGYLPETQEAKIGKDGEGMYITFPYNTHLHDRTFERAILASLKGRLERSYEQEIRFFLRRQQVGSELTTDTLFTEIEDPLYSWMEQSQDHLDTLEIITKVRDQIRMLKKITEEGIKYKYTSMSFGTMPRSIYFAVNGIGVLAPKQLNQPTKEVFGSLHNINLSNIILRVAFQNVEWRPNEESLYISHKNALAQIEKNLSTLAIEYGKLVEGQD